MNSISLAIIGLVAGAAPLFAQHGHPAPSSAPVAPRGESPPPAAASPCAMHGGAGMGSSTMGMMDTMMTVMPQVMRFAPPRLLERQQELNLTADQVSRLTEIGRRADTFRDSAQAAGEAHGRRLRASLSGPEPDAVAADTHLADMQGTMSAMHRMALRAAIEARAILGPEQRGRVEGATTSGSPRDGAPAHRHDH